MQRNELIKIVVTEIEKLELEHPVRVGVSGITASGKSTLAQEIASNSHFEKKSEKILLLKERTCVKASFFDR